MLLVTFQSHTVLSQTKFHPFAGLFASMNSDGFYMGPSYQVGTDYSLQNKTSLSLYIHYFPKKVNDVYDGLAESGKYKSVTAALLLQKHLSKKTGKGLFAGLGLAFQRASDDYEREGFYEEHYKRNMVVGVFRFGYLFSFNWYNLALELYGTGPHSVNNNNSGYADEVQLLTQLSLGIRFIFD